MALPSLAQREALLVEELGRRGFNSAQKAAILGSIKQESSLNPWAAESGGTGLGLFQWSYGRRAKVPKFTGDYATDVRNQLDLFQQELAGSEKRAGAMLMGAKDLQSAAAGMKAFERYGVAGNRYPYMADYAKRLESGQLAGGLPAATAAAAAPAPAGLSVSGLLDTPAPAASSPEAAAAGGGMGAILLDSAALSGLQDPAGKRLAAALVADLELGSAAAKASTGGDGLELVSALAAAPAGQAVAANGRMAGGALGVIGRVADPSEQPYLPSTGAHLDARVIKPDGTYVNPESARSILQNLHVGGKPLYSQSSDGQWVAAAPITSRFGPRNAPTAGASSNHRGTDYGLAAGTQLQWVGPGTVSHQRGYRSIKTPEGYEIRLLHTEAA